MADILILTLVFPPDSVSTARIMGDLARDLRSKGHSINVLSTSPHYNRDAEAEDKQPLRNYWGPVLKKSDYYGIPVYHTIMPKKGSSVFFRLLAWVGFHMLSTFVGIMIIPKPDVIIAPSPPLTIGISAWIIGRICGASFIYNVQKIYPDIAIRLGALRNRRIIRFLFGLERFVYEKAAKVTVIAPRMRQNILEKGVPEGKLVVIPNFVDIDDLSPLPKDNYFSRMHAVHNKFTISYAGNLGVPQGLDTFIEAADLLRQESRIRFMMMGDGMQREALRRRIKKLGLKDFIFLPHQSYSLVPQIYAASDANLVPQATETGFDAVPSKVYRIMACSRPVIALTDPSSDLARLVNDAGCGVVVPPGSAPKLAETILLAYQNREKWLRLGEAGRLYVVQKYARKAVTDRYEKLVRDVISCRDV
jgi:colanic acid biosynthesis glycosyl transferase WcaI